MGLSIHWEALDTVGTKRHIVPANAKCYFETEMHQPTGDDGANALVNEREPTSIFLNLISQLLENAYNTFTVLNEIIRVTVLKAKGVVDVRLQQRRTGKRMLHR